MTTKHIKIYQVDAFADEFFTGSPAAVCKLPEWLGDDLMQKIAMENNLPETAFYVKKDDGYEIRCFIPSKQVSIYGHSTLATAYVIFNYENAEEDVIYFHSINNERLTATRTADLIVLNIPSDILHQIELTDENVSAFDPHPIQAYKGITDYMFVFSNEQIIKTMKPDFVQLSNLDSRGIIITAKGDEYDFVSRFFYLKTNPNEDSVAASSYASLTPYWVRRLHKNGLSATQLSERKSSLHCKYMNERVEISGKGKLFMIGEIFL